MTHRIVSAIALACISAAPAAAETYYGRVFFGTQPVPGASVTATRDGRVLESVTDAQGLFQFADLPAGAWQLRVRMLGFEDVSTNLAVASGQAAGVARFDLKLLPLEALLAVARDHPPVSAPPLIPRPLEKMTAEKMAAEKKAAAPGVAAEAPPLPPADDTAARAADGLLINGSENNAATSKYSLAQAFGNRRQGAKGLYTGSLGLIANQSVLDARPYSLTGLETPKADYSHLTAVFTLGGALRIPHLLRNGPNFFVGYQWTRDRDASTFSGLVPTAAQRAGDLTGTVDALGNPVVIADPNTGQAMNGPVPVSAQARALLALYPLPNLAGSTRYNYQTQVLNTTHADSLQSRLNREFGRRDQVYGAFAFRSVRRSNVNLFAFNDATSTLGIDTNVHWSHRYPHNLLVDTGYRFSRLRTLVRPNFAGVQDVSGAAGIAGNSRDARDWGPPALNFSSGITPLSDGISAFNRNRTDALSVAATWTKPHHTVSFGGDFRRQSFNQLTQANPRGAFTFTGAATRRVGSTVGGSDFADFLLGTPDASQIAYGNADKYFRQSVYDVFVNDDWRLRPELTITTGLRWDYGAPLTELFGRLVNLDIAQGFTAIAPVLANSAVGAVTGNRYPSSLVRPDRRQFQPRVGIAWRPDPASSMVVRAGYGIYADTSVYLTSAQQMAQQAPLSTSVNVSRSANCPLTLANGFQNCAGTSASTFALDPNFRVGNVQTWNLSVQRDLPASLVLTASYLGSKGTHGPQEILPNTNAIGANDPCPSCPRGFVFRTSGANAIRNAGRLQLRRRLRSGVTATLDYTYAKSIDNSSDLGGQGHMTGASTTLDTSTLPATQTAQVAQNWRDLRAERSRSSFDQRHLLKASFQYTSGMGMHGGTLLTGWRGRVLKEWTVAGVISAGSGLPQTPIYQAVVPGTGFTNIVRANTTGAPVYGGAAGYFLNAAAYTIPAAGQWGNAGRNSITGPNQITFDSSLARTFRLHDRWNLDVRADATNLLNHRVFTGWNTVINNTTYGLPANTNAMRSLQITGRLRF